MWMKIRKVIYLFFTAVMFTVIFVGCASNMDAEDLTQTGVFDQNGNLITNTLIYTNRANFSGSIPIWATNLKVDYVIQTNVVNSTNTNYQIIYETNYYVPNLPESAADYYQLYVPWARKGTDFVTISYKDIEGLKQLWLDQVFRKGDSDGKVFAIRNRDNKGTYWYDIKNPFQEAATSQEGYLGMGRQDYYYFADNGDIVYKGGDKDNENGETIIKKYMGAAMVNYRNKYYKNGTNTGIFTIGGIYQMAVDVNRAREKFAGSGPTDGVYEFIAARKGGDFLRQYYSTDFIEILVLNPFGNSDGIYRDGCMALDSYYAYYGEDNTPGAYPVKGFTTENIEWMTKAHLYISKRPEWIIPELNKFTFFTDPDRGWRFLAMPGHKY